MKEAETKTMTIGDIVAQDFRTARIFRDAGIDFCCGGKKTLEETCREKGIDGEDLMEKLENPESESSFAQNYKEWDPGFLSDYIMNVHHVFVRKTLPDLMFYTKKIAKVHGENHPELAEVAALFSEINKELLLHLEKEENVVFPALKELFSNGSERSRLTAAKEITTLQGEHEFAGGAMDRINILTDGYKIPEDACNSYRYTFAVLEKFEDDLHVHVHLENNILFPKALDKLNQQQ